MSESDRLHREAERLHIQAVIMEMLGEPAPVEPQGSEEDLLAGPDLNGDAPDDPEDELDFEALAALNDLEAFAELDEDDEPDDSDEPPPVRRRIRVKVHTPPAEEA